MLEQIFYWTGCLVYVSLGVSLIVVGIFAPAITYLIVKKRAREKMWQWRVAAEIVNSEFSKEEIKAALQCEPPGGVTPEEMFRWFKRVRENAICNSVKNSAK